MPERDDAYVRIEHVTKIFGDVPAVADVSLEVRKGEIFCLLGGSGSGKTTLLRMLAGFETPTAGKLYIDGVDMTTVPPYERPVNMMFQSYALFPHLSVSRNVAFGLEQERLPRAEVRDRVESMLAIVEMTGFGARKPHQLSGGQKQRVALARALVKRPKLLLLDEPLAALDRKLREHTQFELLKIQERLGVTFIVVTHDQQEAMTLATRMGVMNRGRIVQVGTPAEIYESPANRFVADFVGSVNLFSGELAEQGGGGVRIRCAETGCTIHAAHAPECSPGAQVWVALRPEKIELSAEPLPAGENRAQGVVKEIAYMGEASICLIELGSGKTVRVRLPNKEGAGNARLARNAAVSLSWHPASPVVLRE
ncbi:MAG TPA: ABC transporter ATP-binding protein [Steroidobacteraceae bacterium]|nr:ABC transporter ATP-binding protein [Steroidobacteraceae bacterium]